MDRPIDALYEGFVDSLPPALRGAARDLPFLLRLAPASGYRFSQVFSHEVTLEAPLLIAEALPRAGPELVRSAVLAHGLAIVEAFASDRIADGQVEATGVLTALIEELKLSRDRVLERVHTGAAGEARLADERSKSAIREERELLGCIGPASFREYRRISMEKQAPGFPASLALARAAGASDSRILELTQALTGVWLGLQFEDDAGDWEDDWRQGHGAWAVSLARRRLEAVKEKEGEERPTEPDLVRRRVFNMRVLYSMLRDARAEYRTAFRHARILGAERLAGWAKERQQRLDQLLPLEHRHAGYVVRARKLSAWAAEVLS